MVKHKKKRLRPIHREEPTQTQTPCQDDSKDGNDAIFSFPVPLLPESPSKVDLALQGLDPALMDAEFIDPATVLSIPEDPDPHDGGTRLSTRTRHRLRELGIVELFAVQTCLLPFLLPENPLERALYQPYNPPRDACVSAPTGSGKTLAYVLPIIEILSSRIVTRLRALIVLPTRDLVFQLRETFEVVGKRRGLQIGTATGHQSFAHEQTQIVADRRTVLKGGSSKIDVLICTPGRLIDHLRGTMNFTLQHLRFLVVDEADRLLAQSFQDWLPQVLTAINRPATGQSNICETAFVPAGDTFLPLPDAVAPPFLHTTAYPCTFSSAIPCETPQPSCQKLLFSATLTRDPGKIAALNLQRAKYFVVQRAKESQTKGEECSGSVMNVVMERFEMPATLREHMIICTTKQKPLVLFYLLQFHNIRNALVFTKSTESTTRLVRLFDFFWEHCGKLDNGAVRLDNSHFEDEGRKTEVAVNARIVARAYSSDLHPGERRKILERFKSGEIQILICSDLISRGIDISRVSHVVSYDIPIDIRKYVHRAGRTARAGREGDAWTLVEEQEARYFKSMLKEVDRLDMVKRIKISQKKLAALNSRYETALEQLKEMYSR